MSSEVNDSSFGLFVNYADTHV